MAHNALIGGTAYEVSGGTALVDGTGYGLASGKTLVGGTGYEIPFYSGIPVKIVGGENRISHPALAYVEYNGAKYADTTIYVQPDEKVRVYLRASTAGFYANLRFYVYGYANQGTQVSAREKEYYFAVSRPATITFAGTTNYYTATIS